MLLVPSVAKISTEKASNLALPQMANNKQHIHFLGSKVQIYKALNKTLFFFHIFLLYEAFLLLSHKSENTLYNLPTELWDNFMTKPQKRETMQWLSYRTMRQFYDLATEVRDTLMT